MNRFINSLFVSIIVLSMIACIKQDEEWITYKSEEGNFNIDFPEVPNIDTILQETKYGPAKTYTFMYVDTVQKSNPSYALSYTDFPDLPKLFDLQSFYNDLIRSSNESLRGKIVRDTISKFKSYEGREITSEIIDQKFIIKTTYILVVNRLYTLQVVVSKEKASSSSIQDFFDSFNIVR